MTEMNRREFLQRTGRGAFLAGATVAGLSMPAVANATSKEGNEEKMDYKGTKVARVLMDGKPRHVIVEWNDLFELKGDVFGEFSKGKKIGRFQYGQLLSPTDPKKIYCLGANSYGYANFLPKIGREPPKPGAEPVIFTKPNESAVGMSGNLIVPKQFKESGLTGSGELGVIVKATCSKVSPDKAKDYILGYTNAFDALPKALYYADGQVKNKGKTFPTFCPMGPYLVMGMDVTDINQKTYYNDIHLLEGTTSSYILGIEEAVSRISQTYTLEAGDVIIMGAMGPSMDMQNNVTLFQEINLLAGDMIFVETDGLGRLFMTVADEV